MMRRYEKLGAQIGLRVAGICLLVSAWLEWGWLRRLIMMTNPGAGMTGGQFLLAALMFLCASAGVALTVVGRGLWKPVRVSDRWADKQFRAR